LQTKKVLFKFNLNTFITINN